MHDGFENLTVFGESGEGLDGNARIPFRLREDENEGRAALLDQVKGRAQRPEVVRARARRDKDEIGELEDFPVLVGQRRRRVDEAIFKTQLGEAAKPGWQIPQADGRELRRVSLA